MLSDPVVNQIKGFRGRNAGQRFGQTLYNAISFYDAPPDIFEYDNNFHSRLFYIEDKELALALSKWYDFITEYKKSQKGIDNTASA